MIPEVTLYVLAFRPKNPSGLFLLSTRKQPVSEPSRGSFVQFLEIVPFFLKGASVYSKLSGSFLKQGDPNVDPKILYSLI